jgi:hypothetical protein
LELRDVKRRLIALWHESLGEAEISKLDRHGKKPLMQSAWTYKMIDQESSAVGALPGLMVEGEGYGALPFQDGGERD